MKKRTVYGCAVAFLFVISVIAIPAIAQPVGRKVTPVKTSTFNLRQNDSLYNRRADTTKRKKIENEVKPPRELPLPQGAKIIRHRFQASDTTRFRMNRKRTDSVQPNFPGLGDNNTSIPPDIGAAAGPNHLMVALNTQVRIQNKTGTTLSTVDLDAFFSSLGGSPNMFDPKVLYDPFAQRWLITAPANSRSASSSIMIGVSANSDPTGTWTLFQFDVDASNLNWFDFPIIGFNRNWVVVTGNMFSTSGGSFQGVIAYVFDKAALYGGTATPTVFNRPTSDGFNICPAITLDNNEPTEHLVASASSASGTLRLYTITGTPASPVFTATMLFPAAASGWAANPAGLADFAPQSGDSHLIQNNDRRIQNAVFRGGSLWCTHTIFLPAGSSPTRSAIQWWQINPVTGTVMQNSRIEDATGAMFFAFPSIAVNAYNDVLIGYSTFTLTQFASSNFSFRRASDPPNTLQPSVQFRAGLAKYFKTFSGTNNRWGDYSSTCIDPDDFSIWTIQEYAELPSGGFDRWGTEWNLWVPPMPELFSKDVNDDLGAEPNPSTAPMWQSPDIWLRKLQDPTHAFAHMHEDAEFRTGTANPNFVYVEVHNRGTLASSGTEQLTLYWAKASSGLSWTSPWNGGVFFDPGPNTMLMGNVIGTLPIPAVAPGGSSTLEFAWNPPDPGVYATAFGPDQNHFCLLARITSSTSTPFGMTFPETSNLYANVQNNNNIVWKNISVRNDFPGTAAPAYGVVANLTKKPMNTKLTFNIKDADGNAGLLKKGVLRLTVGGKLREALNANVISRGMKNMGKGVMDITEEANFITNILLQPMAYGTLKLEYVPYNKDQKPGGYSITITQLAVVNGVDQIIGGQTTVYGKVRKP